ncbi:MAG: tetratricopeptide repeat protein [Kofleriaceae bacterium]
MSRSSLSCGSPRWWLCGSLLATLIAAAAWAQPPTFQRKASVAIDVRPSARTRPGPSASAARAAPSRIDGDTALSIESLVGTFRAEQEQILLDLIAQTPDREALDRAGYQFMLGELYAKQQRFWRLERERHAIAGRTAESKAAAARARDQMIKAVKVYKALTEDARVRDFPRMDQALFYYGYTLYHGGYADEARKVYDQLLRQYPRSHYVPEAHLAFAEHFFERGELANADARYARVMQFPASPAYWHAAYKRGWIHLAQQRFQDALEAFYQVSLGTQANPKQAQLTRAARKDFVRAYAEIGKADKAYPAFVRLDRASALERLEQLGEIYLDQGKSEKAIAVHRELMVRAPASPRACAWQARVAQAMLSVPRATVADKVHEIEGLVRLYTAVQSKLPASDARDCADSAAAMSGDLSRAYHADYAKAFDPAPLAHAERLYDAYLAAFPAAADRAQMQFYRAELLWTRANIERAPRRKVELWERAAVAFGELVASGSLAPDLRKEAAYAAVLGWMNAFEVDPRIERQADPVDEEAAYTTVPAPLPIGEREQKMVAAFDAYLAAVRDPKDDARVRILFAKANLYRRHNRFDEAAARYRELVERHRDHEVIEPAVHLWIDTYNRMQRYDDMFAVLDRLEASGFLASHPEIKAMSIRLAFQRRTKRALALAEQAKASSDLAKYVACGQGFMDLYNLDPSRDANDEVLYNAMVCYHEGKSIGLAIVAFEVLQRYYPKSKLLPRALARIGKAYGDIAFYDKAAEKLEQYARAYAGEADAYRAMSEAVFFQKGSGDDAKAIANTRFFVEAFGGKRPAEAANAMYALTSVYEKRGDAAAVVRHLREYLHRFGDRGGADRRVIAHAKIGLALWAQSCPVKPVDGSCIQVVRERAIVERGRGRGQRVLQTQCGPPSKTQLRVIPRDARLVREAVAAFAAAARAFEAGKLGGDEAAARHYYAQARLAGVDRDFERYLALQFPANLDFSPSRPAVRDQSLRRFSRWLTDRTNLGVAATAKYDAVLKVKDNATSIAAAARIAQISQNLSHALFTAEIPAHVRTGPYAEDAIDAFCDEMTTIGGPLEARAIEGFRACLTRSTELGWFSDWSRMCERELGQINASEFPTASELRRSPGLVAPIVAIEAPVAPSARSPGAP